MLHPLNQIVEDLAESSTHWHEISLTFDLDPAMPSCLRKSPFYESFFMAIQQLCQELLDAHPCKALYQTEVEGETMTITLSHDGLPVPEGDLQELSMRLESIADRKSKWRLTRSGNLIAAQALQELNGRIRLENLTEGAEGGYRVRTTVELPYQEGSE